MASALVEFLRSVGQGFTQLVFPNLCWVCEKLLSPSERRLCGHCLKQLTADPHPTCPRCSSSVGPHVDLSRGCVHCRDMRFHFERAIRVGPYDGLLQEVILRMKRSAGEPLAEIIGEMWADHCVDRLAELNADLVVPVPLHWWRRLMRGYNQAETLAIAVAKKLSLPCLPHCLRRIRNTPMQSRSTPAERAKNVKGAFIARPQYSVKDKTILLIDDVLTFGYTASEAAGALKKAGAARVYAAVLGHAINKT
jgi:ComF family protein